MGGLLAFSSQITTRLLILLIGFQLFSVCCVNARPILAGVHLSRALVPRRAIINNDTGTPRVFNPDTRVEITQGPASDGAGSGLDLPAILWVVYCGVIGLPMAVAGFRGWRITCGVGIGLATSVMSYAAIINTVDEVGVSDVVLTLIVFAFFFLGFILGLFRFARLGGITMIGITGGLALGIRIALVKEGLLLSASGFYFVNWVIAGILGAAGGLVMIWKQRFGLLFGCSSIGTFLCAISVDVFISKQSGISRGLRFLFDRNTSHLVDILEQGYHPSITTRIIIYASVGLIPILAFIQHKVFKQPFSRIPVPDDSELQIDYPTEQKVDFTPAAAATRPLTQTFKSIWEGARARGMSPNRFSLESFNMLSKTRNRFM